MLKTAHCQNQCAKSEKEQNQRSLELLRSPDDRHRRTPHSPLEKKSLQPDSPGKQTLHQLFQLNPAIHACHDFKERLCDLLRLKTQNVRQCRDNLRKLKKMMEHLTHQVLVEMKKTGITIRK